MPELTVSVKSGSYPILIENKALGVQAGRMAAGCCRGRRAVIVTDLHVANLYEKTVAQSLSMAGFTVDSHRIEPGEGSKNMATVLQIFDTFHLAGLTRDDLVVSLGGGVVGDLAGFAAATWLRGTALFQIPTTLLAQVDSSIGGKNGVDLPYGKNLAGTFHQPKAVLIDPLVLSTLPLRRVAEGRAEVIKSGLIRDAELFLKIEQQMDDLEWIIDRCVRIKAGIVERDEQDHGERMLLNFGHTIGHAVEQVTGFQTWSHGEAVAIGMITALKIGEHLGLTPNGTANRVRVLLEKTHLPAQMPELPSGAVLAAVSQDKKKRAGKIHFILLRSIGEAFVHPMTEEELSEALTAVWHHD